VIHGDLKGVRGRLERCLTVTLISLQSNVLVKVVDSIPRALIADFGITIVAKNSNSIRSPTGQPHHNPRWSAPEVLNGENPSTESDVFSFGMTMFEVRR
jgi:serine/threonine protein kinase